MENGQLLCDRLAITLVQVIGIISYAYSNRVTFVTSINDTLYSGFVQSFQQYKLLQHQLVLSFLFFPFLFQLTEDMTQDRRVWRSRIRVIQFCILSLLLVVLVLLLSTFIISLFRILSFSVFQYYYLSFYASIFLISSSCYCLCLHECCVFAFHIHSILSRPHLWDYIGYIVVNSNPPTQKTNSCLTPNLMVTLLFPLKRLATTKTSIASLSQLRPLHISSTLQIFYISFQFYQIPLQRPELAKVLLSSFPSLEATQQT